MTSTPVPHPITATYAPSSSFLPPRRRSAAALRPHLRRRSSSSSGTASSSYLSTASFSSSEEDEDEDDSSEFDEEDTDSDGSLSSSGGGLERTSGLMRSVRAGGEGMNTRTALPTTPGTSQPRSHLKLSLALLRVRQSLSPSYTSFDALATALKSLSASLPPPPAISTLGVFIPILERLSRDLEDMLGEEEKGSREWRRGLGKEDAKALVGLRQRWGGTGKGKQKDGGELDWVGAVRALVAANPPPSFLQPQPALRRATITSLTSLESLLLPSSLPRLSLANLNLTSSNMKRLDVLDYTEEVLEWYLSFQSPDQESRTTARSILLSVRSLDLSKNRLKTLPPTLPSLFPRLETLSLSHNLLRLLPPSITLFSHLRRLKINGNELARRGRTKLPRPSRRGSEQGMGEEQWMEFAEVEQKGAVRGNTREVVQVVRARMGRWREASAQFGDEGAGDLTERREEGNSVESLVEISLQVIRTALLAQEEAGEGYDSPPAATEDPSNPSPSDPSSPPSSFSILADLPPHLSRAITHSYTCASCHAFISPLSTLSLPSPSSPPPKPISLHLPPLYERLHHLSPGVSLPTQIRAPPPHYPSSPTAPAPPHHLTTEERVLLALYGRNTELVTLVVGDEVHHRFCTRCAVGHLGLLGEESGSEGGKERLGRECGCKGCDEERRVKGETLLKGRSGVEREGEAEDEQGERVMRWLRRRTRARGSARGLAGGR
ncbi:hypothetical protein BCR35DRAFT_299039 [Leucosporidium creatinivorum]|uniref:Uncharacterized protein n=1 Tax=Leucosporidium creatinivorum TaxID=106004 RepID=A0A1Y2G2Z2_9BASI|nr:hypothetical protein BCR35DRAFT_299039 [Leucosporidium creatinivorum]